MAASVDISSLEKDPRLFLYTSLTSGSSHIITATSRMETILKANKIPFQAIDTATDEKARKLWQRRAGKRKLPGLVKEGYVLGDLEEIEEWNEFGELKDNIGPVPANNAAPPGGQTGINIAPPLAVNSTATGGTTKISQAPPGGINKAVPPLMDKSKTQPLPSAAEVAAKNKPQTSPISASMDEPPKAETMSSAPVDKEQSISEAKEAHKDNPALDHLSAPASALQSGTATPAQEPVNDEAALREEKTMHGDSGDRAEADEDKSASASAEDDEDDGEDDSAAKAVQGLQVGEGADVQEQSAADGGDAGKSVED